MAETKTEGFLSRWSRRKADARHESELPDPLDPGSAAPVAVQQEVPEPLDQPNAPDMPACLPEAPADSEKESAEAPALTLADVARLTQDSDFSPFMASGVDAGVKNAALKKLFSDPHFNLMDGLDVYIDDYNTPSPLPRHLLLKMVQAKFLGLATDKADQMLARLPDVLTDVLSDDAQNTAPPQAAVSVPSVHSIASHEDADLQLQPDDDARRSGVASGPGEDAGHEH